MDRNIYENCLKFKRKYPSTVAWRLKKHSSVIQEHLNDDEVALYTFCGQYNYHWYEMFFSCVVVFTNKRMLIGRKRFFGQYNYYSITPDMLNDFEVRSKIFWGMVEIDTIKEHFTISNLSKKSLPEIENAVSKYFMNEKLRLLKKKTKEEK